MSDLNDRVTRTLNRSRTPPNVRTYLDVLLARRGQPLPANVTSYLESMPSPQALSRQQALAQLLRGQAPAQPQPDPRLAKQMAMVQALRMRPPVQPL